MEKPMNQEVTNKDLTNKEEKKDQKRELNTNASSTNDYFDGHFEEKIPESQGDLADRAENEIESDIQWRIDLIRRANREGSKAKRQ